MADDGQSGQGAGRRAAIPWGWWAALAVPWLACAWWLWPMWSHAVENHYGYAVFPLAAYLLFVRWEAAPAAQPPASRGARWGWALLVSVGLTILGAGGLLLAASPLWPLAMWLAVLGAVAIAWGMLGRVGGGLWVRHGLFPLLFAFTALPWPSRIEDPTMGWLRGINAQCAAEIVSVLGRPAVARGNVIETSRGFAGVEEACSGIVALKTALMLALFLGELRQLRRRDRVVLVFGAVLLALLVNMGRASWLVWLIYDGKTEAMHDVAGTIELLVAIAAVGVWSMWYGRSREMAPPVSAADAGMVRAVWAGPIVTAVSLIVAGVSGWYARPAEGGALQGWTMAVPEADWRAIGLSDVVKRQLQPEESQYLQGRERETGRDWVALYLRWETDPGFGFGAAGHGPEVCLPASGSVLEADLGQTTMEVAGRRLALHGLRFRSGGDTFYTFSGLWDPLAGRSLGLEASGRMDFTDDRLARVREGRKRFALERITIAFNRCYDPAEAEARLREMLPRLLQPRLP